MFKNIYKNEPEATSLCNQKSFKNSEKSHLKVQARLQMLLASIVQQARRPPEHMV